MDYYKIGKASDLEGKDRSLYRFLEIIPGFLSWATFIILIIVSYLKPIWATYFIIAFDVYWLLLVMYLSIHLLSAYGKMKKTIKIDWKEKLCRLPLNLQDNPNLANDCLAKQGIKPDDIYQVIFLPTLNETVEVLRPTFQALLDDGFPAKNMIVVLGLEEREGPTAPAKGEIIKAPQKLNRFFNYHSPRRHQWRVERQRR